MPTLYSIENEYPDGLYHPKDSYTKDRFENYGAARFFYSPQDLPRLRNLFLHERLFRVTDEMAFALDRRDGLLSFDIVIHKVTQNHVEFDKIQPFIGDCFSHTFYGTAPTQVSVEATLLETSENNQKKAFMDCYRNLFRLAAVAKNKVAPVLWFQDTFLMGAMLDLTLQESGTNSELIHMNFNYLLLNISYIAPASGAYFAALSIDYFTPGYSQTRTNTQIIRSTTRIANQRALDRR